MLARRAARALAQRAARRPRCARAAACRPARSCDIQVHILAPSKSVLPISSTTRSSTVDKLMLNNNRLHNKVSTAHSQPGAAPPLALIPAPADDVAAAARDDLLEPNAAAEC